jgi:hypothetical protein
MMTPADELVTRYRKADQRLRLLLLGDGTETAGVVRGEEARLQVARELRHIRDAFDAVLLGSEEGRAETSEARVADLEEELRKIASSGPRHRAEFDNTPD